jgi:hypothetical protein
MVFIAPRENRREILARLNGSPAMACRGATTSALYIYMRARWQDRGVRVRAFRGRRVDGLRGEIRILRSTRDCLRISF